MRPIGIGMIGYGGVARVHALAYRAIPFHYGIPAGTVKIVGIADVNAKAAEQQPRKWVATFG
jgi:predicted dehydrogenase